MGLMVRSIVLSDIQNLNSLPPSNWMFDLESLMMKYYYKEFFKSFVIQIDDNIVGVGSVTVNNNIGWLGNIFIQEDYRGRGLGTKMTSHLLDYLSKMGCNSKLLFASKEGRSIYSNLGFNEVSDFCQIHTRGDSDFNRTKAIKKLLPKDYGAVIDMDERVNGECRKHLISDSMSTGYGYFDGELLGYYLPDYGRGLVIAINQEAGLILMKMKHSYTGKSSIVPSDNRLVIDTLISEECIRGDVFTKMYIGSPVNSQHEYMYALGSGFCG